jgi:hypothetical protein
LDVHETFERLKGELLRSHPGQFAVLCHDRLVGVYRTVDDAVLAVSRAFDDQALPEAAPVLISELAEPVTVRVTAHAYPRTAPALSTPA